MFRSQFLKFISLADIVASLCIISVVDAHAASKKSGSWFVPQKSAPAPQPASPPIDDSANANADTVNDQGPQQMPILPLPPVQNIPPIPKEATPPAAIIGVISVQGVMQYSSAAQEIQQILGARRDKLARAVQKEEAAWRGEQQKLQMQARMLTSEQIQLREKHLQERRAKDQRDFGNQARIIQEAYQVAFHQIERCLEQKDGIISRVAMAHGMNLILHGEQVVLHVDAQDITEEVTLNLNKILPHVFIPDENVDPEVLAKTGKMLTTADEEKLLRQNMGN